MAGLDHIAGETEMLPEADGDLQNRAKPALHRWIIFDNDEWIHNTGPDASKR
jgi:hypothetical protein